MDTAKLRPALIGGASFGVLANVPYVSEVNIVCGALFIGGGVLASYLFFKDREPMEGGRAEGAKVGCLAGLFGGLVATAASLLMRGTGIGQEEAELADALAQAEAAGFEPPAWVRTLVGGEGLTVTIAVLILVMTIIFFSVAATVGGLLGAVFFNKEDVDAL